MRRFGSGSFARAVKRSIDVTLCTVLILVLWPALIAIAVAVRLSSPGRIFFVQDRVGQYCTRFRMIKFRTMRVRGKSEQENVWTAADEAAITRLGRFLRDYGLDELPQLFNILKGDMSIVGPRPPLVTQLDDHSPSERHIFDMRPGVLSLAVVKGRRSISVSQRRAYHLEYVEHWSIWLDCFIFWRSIFIVLGRESASESLPNEGSH